ncbi:MAG: endonuclease domain-containing protein, partial [Acidimicrobiales bacterium]
RLFTIAGVETALEAVARRGRRGAGVLRRILDERALGDARPDSLLESRMARLLKSAELPPAAFQHDIYAGRRFVGRVDFAYPEVRLAIEVDGWEAHASPEALQGDLSRQNALVGAGWTVLRFTWHDIVRRPPAVATAITRVLGPLTLAQRR